MSAAPATCGVATVAVFAPLRQTYDYLCPGATPPRVGARVWVPFGRAERIGVVLAVDPTHAPRRDDLKPLYEVLDHEPLLSPAMLGLAAWSAAYYHHPPGEVLAAMLPTWLRRRRPPPEHGVEGWQATAAGRAALDAGAIAGKRQREVLSRLVADGALSADGFADLGFDWRAALRRLLAQQRVERVSLEAPSPPPLPGTPGVVLNAEQRAALAAILRYRGRFRAIVLHGVTGSGKTEVYLEAIAAVIADGGQALVLVPEIALTQHLVARFRARFGDVALLHSALGERRRALEWKACREGRARVLLGTRSAVWVELPDLALVVVDEEHDAAYKQQDGFRYSARDVAVVRAQRAGVPVVLGSATPALETLANVERGKFGCARLEQRAGAAMLPEIRRLDVRGMTLEGGLSTPLVVAMREHLGRGEQVMLFLNRRGYAPLLLCRSCGEPVRCTNCDAFLVYHRHLHAARCHHCDRHWSLKRPVRCCEDEDIVPIGHGTERLEEVVSALFPGQRVRRIDRDTMRRPGALEEVLAEVAARRVDILIGTQMVAKGLDFADVTLVGIVDADSRLYSVDFRAEERLAQLIHQVAGRAGRAAKRGTVLVQTHQPQHPVLRRIIDEGYERYAAVALAERREAGLPPYAAMALVRADARDPARPQAFLGEVRGLLLEGASRDLDVSFPIPALMERRAGRYRALIVIRSTHRTTIGRLLEARLDAIAALARGARVRFSLDIDPQETL